MSIARKLVVLALLIGVIGGCSREPSGELDDLGGLAEEFSVEEVAENDPRILAFDLGRPLDGSVMRGGRMPQIAFRDENCGPLPNVSISAAGQRLDIIVLDANDARPCGGGRGRIVLITMTLKRDFPRSSLSFNP